MGGTTAKAALIENGSPSYTTDYEIGAGISLSSKLVTGGGHAVKVPGHRPCGGWRWWRKHRPG